MFQHQSRVGVLISQILIVLAILVLAVPLVMIVMVSLEGEGLHNYAVVLGETPFWRFFMNSSIIAVVTVLTVLACAISAAFAIGILRPRGSRTIMLVILGGMSLPALALVVPLYAVIQRLGLLNTHWAVIIPLVAVSIPFGVLLSTNFVRGLPIELYEAARLDGASDFGFFTRILLPMSKPILAVISVIVFLGAWSEYLLPLIFIQDTSTQVLTQVPTYFQSQRLVDVPKVFAASVLVSLPIVVFYVMLQDAVRQGMASGSVK